MKYAKEDDLLAVLLALEERIMRRLQVATFGIVTKLDTARKKCYIKAFPVEDANKISETECVYMNSLESDLIPGSIVIVIYMDKDFRKNLEQVLGGNITPQTPSSKTMHGDSNAVIIQIFQKKEVM